MITYHIGLFANLFNMTKTIILVFDIEGHHSWKNPFSSVDFLKNEHRHLFRIRLGIKVNHNNRDKEIFIQQQYFRKYLKDKYETLDKEYKYHNFGNMSCEDIAEELINLDNDIQWVEVLEDNLGGAKIER
tara:strand:+ start:11 stop:400 length:390 start_codon:yes stop_codon:yes gene_type:complete